MPAHIKIFSVVLLVLSACHSPDNSVQARDLPFVVSERARFDLPWAMAFLPDGRLLVTEKRGALQLLDPEGGMTEVSGVPPVSYGGQGGLGDIVLHPEFTANSLVYFSYVEAGADGHSGAVVARARLILNDARPALESTQIIWRQSPKVTGKGHFGHRIAFGPEGYLWISSGDRQKFDPAQDMQSHLGKIIRLRDDGSVPDDNPFASQGAITNEIWSLGHRNPLGLAFDTDGNLWNTEMGPRDGDELNRVRRGANYGYPIVSEGTHYDGKEIPAHATRPEFAPPALSWIPAISPSGLMFYAGSEFPEWRGDAFIGGLSGMTIVRVEIDGETAAEAARYDLGKRIRAVHEGPDGALWVLVDGRGPSAGQLLRLSRPAT